MNVPNAICLLFNPSDSNALENGISMEAVIDGYTWNLSMKFDLANDAAFAKLRCLTIESVQANIRVYHSTCEQVLFEAVDLVLQPGSSYDICLRNLRLQTDFMLLTAVVEVTEAGESAVVVDQPYADVRLNVDGAKFHCNRGFLSAVSPVFGAMFNEDFKEKDQPEVTVADVDESSFGTFLMAMHPEKPIAVTSINVATIARLADRFQVSSLLLRCVVFLHNVDAFSNFEKLLLLDEIAQYGAMDKVILRLTPSEVKEAVNDERFRALSKECLQKLLQHYARVA